MHLIKESRALLDLINYYRLKGHAIERLLVALPEQGGLRGVFREDIAFEEIDIDSPRESVFNPTTLPDLPWAPKKDISLCKIRQLYCSLKK